MHWRMLMSSTGKVRPHQRALDLAYRILRAAKRARLAIPVNDLARHLTELRSEARVQLQRHLHLDHRRPVLEVNWRNRRKRFDRSTNPRTMADTPTAFSRAIGPEPGPPRNAVARLSSPRP